jgi:hypothetical protein
MQLILPVGLFLQRSTHLVFRGLTPTEKPLELDCNHPADLIVVNANENRSTCRDILYPPKKKPYGYDYEKKESALKNQDQNETKGRELWLLSKSKKLPFPKKKKGLQNRKLGLLSIETRV